MTIQDVIELKSSYVTETDYLLQYLKMTAVTLCATLLISIVFLWNKPREILGHFFNTAFYGTLFMSFVFGVYVYHDLTSEDKLDEYKEWENAEVKPYVQSLPLIKGKVIDFEFKEDYVYTSDGKRRAIVWYVREEELFKIETRIKTSLSLPEDTEKQIEYRYLPETISDNYKEDYYDAVLFLPKNYDFKKEGQLP